MECLVFEVVSTGGAVGAGAGGGSVAALCAAGRGCSCACKIGIVNTMAIAASLMSPFPCVHGNVNPNALDAFALSPQDRRQRGSVGHRSSRSHAHHSERRRHYATNI